ncbi:MAG TPA: glycosyltransferase family 4 protein [Luteimonas sp.]|nr:glycosyltransferase family 4 protein [Luteimonas sp.]
MPELQGMGHDQAAAELRGGLSMPGLPVAIAWLALLFVASLAGTVAARRYAIRRDLLDHPGERRSHVVATPRGGGIGIVVAMLGALGLLAWWNPAQALPMALAATGLLLVSGIGWIDDHRPLTPWSRLAVHAVASVLLAAVAYGAGGQWVCVLLAFALCMVLVNIWNFMDGIDGIAALQALVVAAAIALLANDAAARWIALALAAACFGFLPLNLPRARIFLGDVGSGALGYLLALAMVLVATGGGQATSPAAWVLLLLPPSAFFLDASLTLLVRMLRGERWWTPHVGHLYQRAAREVGRHWPVTLAYAAWAMVAGGLAFAIRDRPETFIMCSGIAWYLGGGILWLGSGAHRGLDSGLPGKQSG